MNPERSWKKFLIGMCIGHEATQYVLGMGPHGIGDSVQEIDTYHVNNFGKD